MITDPLNNNISANDSAIQLDAAAMPSSEDYRSESLYKRAKQLITKAFSADLAHAIKDQIENGSVQALKQAKYALTLCKAVLDVGSSLKIGGNSGDPDGEKKRRIHPALVLVSRLTLATAVFCWATGKSKEKPISADYYPLPESIEVVETNLPHKVILSKDSDKQVHKFIEPQKLDLSGDFDLKTERYHIIKEKDFILSRMVGHVMSIPTKLFFWDVDAGLGLDENRTKAVISMLEQNKEIQGLTVRINNNGVINDTCRLFFDEDVCKRNGFAARATVGLLFTVSGEMFQELRRGDYYNPMTQTVALYSDISSVAAHEIGHHQDFQRFDRDWWYALSRAFPPSMLYQEWEASDNASSLVDPKDSYQFYRYLLPAFATYILGSYYMSKQLLVKFANDSSGIERYTMKDITPEQTMRFLLTTNAQFYAGIYAYTSMMAMGSNPLLGVAGFGAGFLAAGRVGDAFMQESAPYNHER